MAHWRAWVLPWALSALIITASGATLLLLGHPTVAGCPGSSITGIINCRAVVSSAAGRVLNVPLGAWALTWLAMFWLAHWFFPKRFAWIVLAGAIVGIAYAIGTELHVGHVCMWCSVDQLSILFLGGWSMCRSQRMDDEKND